MGRHRNRPVKLDASTVDSIVREADDAIVDERVEARLGFDNMICTSCEANNPPNADKCRKCGCTQLREKNSDFADK